MQGRGKGRRGDEGREGKGGEERDGKGREGGDGRGGEGKNGGKRRHAFASNVRQTDRSSGLA